MGVSRKQSTSNFPKNKDFLPPDTHMRAKFLSCILLYHRYNYSFLSYFAFASFFNYHRQMAILIVYLTIKGLVSLFPFFHLL